MKKIYPILFSFSLLLCLAHTSMAQNVIIPNATFKAYLLGNAYINTDGDADIQLSEAIAYSGDIVVPSMNITDLTGIEAFTSITHLNCAFNQLTSLNVSENTALNYLYCDDNLLTSLDVSANTALTLLHCLSNSLTSLDVSENTALKYLKCFDNSITNLNLSTNTTLESLWAYNNSISTLDLSANTALNTLKIGFNNLTNLDVSANTALINLYCENNLLTNLDVSTNAVLRDFYCQNNSLTSLDVRNGNNANIGWFDARNNPDLSCISVSDIAYASGTWGGIDPGVEFNLECTAGSIVANFSADATSGAAPLAVQFTDASTGSPSSWSWAFGDGNTSDQQSPTHNYITTGTYTVALTVGDGTSTDTETKTDYINVTGSGSGSDYLMSNATITTDDGIFYDAGGSTGDYSSSEQYTMTFVPATTGSKLKFVFEEFNIEPNATCGWDYLEVYDSNTADPTALIGTYCNTTPIDQIEATNADGAITFVFQSDGSAEYSGWRASITSIPSGIPISSTETENNDLYADANAMSPNSNMTGNIDDPTDLVDWYKVTIPYDGSLSFIGIPGASLNIALDMYETNGTTIIKSCDHCGGTGENDTLTYNNLMAGTYYLSVARHYLTFGNDSYTLKNVFVATSIPEGNDSEPNMLYTEALTLPLDGSATGHMGYSSNDFTDVGDMYKVTIPYDGSLSFIGIPGASLDIALTLYDTNGTTNIKNCDHCGGTGENDTLTYNNLMAGTYYLSVARPYLHFGYGSYMLKNVFVATSIPEGNDTEPNMLYTEALTMTIDGSATGHMGFFSNDFTDVGDMYKVTIPYDGSLSFIGIPGASLDIALTLYDTNGTTNIKNCDHCGGTGENDTLTYNNLMTGTYYLSVARPYLHFGYGSYTLKNVFVATSIPEGNDTEPNMLYTEALTLAVDGSTTGHMGFYSNGITDEADMYKVTIPYDGSLSFIGIPGASLDIALTLYDTNGTTNIKNCDHCGGTGENDTLTYNNLMAGTYYLSVARPYLHFGYGSYTLKNVFVETGIPTGNDTEPNTLYTEALTIAVDGSTTGHMGFYSNGITDEADMYKVTIPYDGSLSFIGIPESSLNLSLELFDVDGVSFLHGCNIHCGYSGENDTLTTENLVTGTYYLKISGLSASYGSYTLKNQLKQVSLISDFSADETVGEAPFTVNFTDLSSGATSWIWDFGDGTATSGLQSPSHTYISPGTYTVKLKISDGIVSKTETKEDYITVNGTKVIALSGNMNFGNVALEATSMTTLSIANTGNVSLSITDIDLPPGFTADWTSGTIVANGSQNVIITFAPTEAKQYTGTITVNGNQTSGANTIAISGTGIIQTITGIEDIKRATLNCYPNPVVDLLNITFDRDMESMIIVNLQGLTVFKKNGLGRLNGKLQLDVSGFKAGEYIIQIMKKEKKETLKVLIVN